MKTFKTIILDVDGVLTDGKFYYSKSGKMYKVFGPDDNDALKLLDQFFEIIFVSADHRGFEISKKRIVDDMKRPIFLVEGKKRIQWIKERYNPNEVIYIGDGIFDFLVFEEVGYSITPSNPSSLIISDANYVSKCIGSERFVADSVYHILKEILGISDIKLFIKESYGL
jgi:3-deoxy-D-manno-octulosonate 8-phosphate phosphatase (KDO 8-P phosphatase)